MKSFFGDLKNIISDRRCSIPVILTALLSFGWQLTRFNVGIDDTVRFRYFGGGSFSQGRFAGVIVKYMFGLVKAFPFFEPFLAVLFLTAAAFLMILLFKRAAKGAVPDGILTFFACAFVSYPLINEIFVYKGSDINICVGYFLTAVALLITSGIFRKRENSDEKPSAKSIVLRLVSATLVMIFTVSLYEALAAVYLVTASLLIFAEITVSEKKTMKKDLTETPEEKTPEPHYGRNFFILLIPAAAGTVIEYIAGLIVNSLVDFEYSIPAGAGIYLPESLNGEYFVNMIYTIGRRLFLAGIWYFPVGMFVFCLAASLAVFIAVGIVKKRGTAALCAIGTYAGLFGIPILAGGTVKYRNCIEFAPFVAFMLAFLICIATLRFKGNGRRIIANVLAGIIIILQAVSLNISFYDNDLRWQEEKAVLVDCGEALTSDENLNLKEKPVIFIGDYRLSDNILSRKYVRADDPVYKLIKGAALGAGFKLETTDLDDEYVLAVCQSDFGSVISWGIHDAYSCNEELLLVFKELGYEFTQGSRERYDELTANLEAFPVFNETGVFTELEDCIVVRFR